MVCIVDLDNLVGKTFSFQLVGRRFKSCMTMGSMKNHYRFSQSLDKFGGT